MMKKLALIVLVVVFAAAAWMGSAQAADTIKIGFNAPLTGFAASDGKSASEGAKLAVEQINSAGGVNGKMIELVIYDDQAKPAQAIPIANKLGRIGQLFRPDPVCCRYFSGSRDPLHLRLCHPSGYHACWKLCLSDQLSGADSGTRRRQTGRRYAG
jgi:hypothetical protein